MGHGFLMNQLSGVYHSINQNIIMHR